MKPPPRKRSKPEQRPAEPVLFRSGKWKRFELSRLLTGLKKLSRSAAEEQEVDYCALKEHIKSRSVTEIQSMVDSLKNRVISCASFTLKKRRQEERRTKKPIELWTHMSSSLAGTQEETINTAFAQMLIVSSKEPHTLRYCDPPRIESSNPDQNQPSGRTVPFRPMPRPAPGPGVRPVSRPAPPLKAIKTPAPIVSPAGRHSAPSQLFQVSSPQTKPGSNPGASLSQVAVSDHPQSSSQTSVTPLPSVPGPATSPNSASLHQTLLLVPPPLSSSSALGPVSSPSAPSLSPAPLTQPSPLLLSSQAASLCTCFGRTSKYATQDSPRVLGLKCVVDFEKIYTYLSSILKPEEECCLTPMEGAIVLDLLMSLMEELPQLDCNELKKHLAQMYQTLSSPPDSKLSRDLSRELSRDLSRDLQDGLSPGTEPPASPDPQQSTNRSSDTQSGVVTRQPNEASSTTSNQEADIPEACPPLNPFMVPVELLKRRDIQPQLF